jgi:hypothetical protein
MKRRGRNVGRFRTPIWAAIKGTVGLLGSMKVMTEPTAAGTGTPSAAEVARIRGELERDVRILAREFPGRGMYRLPTLRACEAWIAGQIEAAGLMVERQAYRVGDVEVVNYHATVRGAGATRDEIVVVGAHYDAVELLPGYELCPAANDNGSGVAATLFLMREFATEARAGRVLGRTLRFSFWVNEEPPYFWTEEMGSLVDARARQAAGERIVAMLTPETIGCFSSKPGSQQYPPIPGLREKFGDAGDFIALIGMSESHEFVRRCVALMREHSDVKCAGAALPAVVPGVGASDHWSFWRCGFPALMITDTAPFRYEFYHTPEDVPEKMDFEMMSRVVCGLRGVVRGVMG